MSRQESNSSLAMYRSCPRKYCLHYIDHLEPLQPRGQHDLDFGSAGHSAMEVLYGPNGSVKAAQAAFAAAYPPESYPATLPLWSQGKSFVNGVAAIAAYTQRWREDDANWEILQVEHLETPLDPSEKVLRLDLVVRDRRDDQVYGVDHKWTGKYLNNKYWLGFDPNSQIRDYVAHIKKRWGHCGGFYINAVSFKHRSRAYTPRQGPQKGVQQPAGDWFDFARMCFNPNSDCLAIEAENSAYWVSRIEADRASGIWGYNDQTCLKGGIECEYLKLCSAGYRFPEDEELVLGYYRQMCGATVAGGKCQLNLNHEGEHDATRLLTEQEDFNIEETEEYAIS